MANCNREALEARNAARRALKLPVWARSLRPNQKVHILSTVFPGKVRCRKSTSKTRWVSDDIASAAHPSIFRRKICEWCAMMHEPQSDAPLFGPVGMVHARSRLRPEESVCRLPLSGVRWVEEPSIPLGMCNSCCKKLYNSSIMAREPAADAAEIMASKVKRTTRGGESAVGTDVIRPRGS